MMSHVYKTSSSSHFVFFNYFVWDFFLKTLFTPFHFVCIIFCVLFFSYSITLFFINIFFLLITSYTIFIKICYIHNSYSPLNYNLTNFHILFTFFYKKNAYRIETKQNKKLFNTIIYKKFLWKTNLNTSPKQNKKTLAFIISHIIDW